MAKGSHFVALLPPLESWPGNGTTGFSSQLISGGQYQIDKQSKRQLLATRPLVSEGEAVALCCSQLPPAEPS